MNESNPFCKSTLSYDKSQAGQILQVHTKKREALLQLQLHVLCVCVSAAKTVAVLANSFATLRILPDGR
jgi:hypothetical protein